MDVPRSRNNSESAYSRSSSLGLSIRDSSYSVPGSPSSSTSSTPRTFGPTKFDSSSYNAGQSLASVLNNPKLGKSGIYGNDSSWTWIFQGNAENVQEGPPPIAPGILPEVSMADFQPYLSRHSEDYGRFVDVREHATWEQSMQNGGLDPGGSGDARAKGEGVRAQGEGLLACLREIPPLYFDSDFALENGATFSAVGPFTNIPANMMLQEKLSHYLDLVEVHLVKEISSRSDSFFEALGQLEDLNSGIVEACEQIRQLQQTVGLLDTDLVEAAQKIQLANMRRSNLLALEQKLRLLSYVEHALSTLRLLVGSADCAAALDVIDDMRRLLESDDLVGLHCFRHLGSHLNQAAESVNSMLMADFVREAIHGTWDLEPKSIAAAFNGRKEFQATAVKGILQEGTEEEDDEAEQLKEQLLPIVIGLLRTSKLPAVLRTYRETLITDIKAAIKCVVGELLPVLFTQPVEGDAPPDSDGGQSLAYKLRGLSPDAFLQLLTAVFAIVQTRLKRAAQVRYVIEQILGGLQDSYAAAAVAAAFASGAAHANAGEAAEELSKGKALSSTAASELALVNSASAIVSAANISKQFRGDVLRENTEAVCAGCDAAHGRWAKLLGVRALVHPKLALHEFVAMYDITNDFISGTEKVGGRLGYSIRGTLQSQSKSFVDAQHSARLTKVAGHLDSETWVAIDAPDEHQAIADAFTTDSSFELATETPGGNPVESATSREQEVAANNLAKTASANGTVPAVEGTAPVVEDRGDVVAAQAAAESSSGGALEAGRVTSGNAKEESVQPNGISEGAFRVESMGEGDAATSRGDRARAGGAEETPTEGLEGARETRAGPGDATEGPEGGAPGADGSRESDGGEGASKDAEDGVRAGELAEVPGLAAGAEAGQEVPAVGTRGNETVPDGQAASTDESVTPAVEPVVKAASTDETGTPVNAPDGQGAIMGEMVTPVNVPDSQAASMEEPVTPVTVQGGKAASTVELVTPVKKAAADSVKSASESSPAVESGNGTQTPKANGSGAQPESKTQGTPAAPVHAPAGQVSPAPGAPAQAPRAAKSRPTVKTLQVRGQGYHVVSSALLMLKTLAEYLDIANALPALATEVVHRVAELLKLFNSRVCQLVLGAGAMQVSGLKSITAKHLALSSQCIGLFYALIGDIRRMLSVHIPEARKTLLLTEIDRVGQDYRVHRDEIHSKLVAIMKERLQVHLRSLPAMVEGWNRPDDGDQQASQFARALTKEVGVLHRVLSPLLLEADLRSIFTRVGDLFHVQLADTFAKIETSTPQARRRLYRDIQLVLQCVRALPADVPVGVESKSRELETLLQNRFPEGAPP